MIIKKKKTEKNALQKEEILERIQNLGFEVGYFHHNEDGWVIRKYRELLSHSKAYDNIDFEEYYEAAKQEGREKRKQDIAKGLSKKSETSSEPKEHVTVKFSEAQVKSSDKVVSQNAVGPIKRSKLVERPEVTSKPDVIKKGKILRAPKFLH